MPEIHFVEVHLALAGEPGYPNGQTAKGSYTVDGDTVTLVHPITGNPVRDENGKIYTDKVGPGTVDAHGLAGVLTRQFRLARMGKTPSTERFSRRLPYKKLGLW
jgi:hypothetical protein